VRTNQPSTTASICVPVATSVVEAHTKAKFWYRNTERGDAARFIAVGRFNVLDFFQTGVSSPKSAYWTAELNRDARELSFSVACRNQKPSPKELKEELRRLPEVALWSMKNWLFYPASSITLSGRNGRFGRAGRPRRELTNDRWFEGVSRINALFAQSVRNLGINIYEILDDKVRCYSV
jgi:hypothetical protein